MQLQEKPVSVTPVFKRKPSAQIQCDMRLICPQRWGNLKKTDDANVRHCQVCAREVHYCRNETALAAAIAESHCVAFVVQAPDKPKKMKLLGDPSGLKYLPQKPKESMAKRLWKKIQTAFKLTSQSP